MIISSIVSEKPYKFFKRADLKFKKLLQNWFLKNHILQLSDYACDMHKKFFKKYYN